jgi:DNA repair protein RadC
LEETYYRRYRICLIEEEINYSSYGFAVKTSSNVRDILVKDMCLHMYPTERMVVFALNIKNELIGACILGIGGLNTAIVEPRSVFQFLMLTNAAAGILCHNHPSGDTTPSAADIDVTRTLVNSGKILNIKILDHIIIGISGDYNSLRDGGFEFG